MNINRNGFPTNIRHYQNQLINYHIPYYPAEANQKIGYVPNIIMGNGVMYKPIKYMKKGFVSAFEKYVTPKHSFTGSLVLCEKVGDKTVQRPFYFEYIVDGDEIVGVFVSDQINKHTNKPYDKMIQALYKELDYGVYNSSEDRMLTLIEHLYPKVFPLANLIKHPTVEDEPRFSFTLSNRGTKRRYRTYYKKTKKKDYPFKTVWVRPDFIDRHPCNKKRVTVIEVENSFHNTLDFLWKLWRLSGTKLKVYFIFTDHNKQHHLEAIARFRRETGRKVYRFHFTTIEKLKEYAEKDPNTYEERDIFTRFTDV
jgi:hypothetical protein